MAPEACGTIFGQNVVRAHQAHHGWETCRRSGSLQS